MKKSIRDFSLDNKRVIIRCDFNVPIKDGKIIDDNRIKESLQTIEYAIKNGAKVILMSHLGRIKEKEDLVKNTLRPVAKRLSELLKRPVIFISETTGKYVDQTIINMNAGDIVLLENTRFEDLNGKKESSNDSELGKYWSSLGDIFINEAFGTIHRSHASNVGIASYLPSGIGFLVEKEFNALARLEQPNRPYVVILGGAKVSDKIGVISNLVNKADKIIIGGAMAFTFLKANGYEIGKSLIENDYIDFCKEIISKYNDKLVLPIDIAVSESVDSGLYSIKEVNNLSPNDMGLDLGNKTITLIKEMLNNAKTVVWNGPLGYYEKKAYQTATKEILSFLVDNNIDTTLGGGDIVACSSELGYKDKVTHASTGGGATLEYLEGKKLPGLEIINDK